MHRRPCDSFVYTNFVNYNFVHPLPFRQILENVCGILLTLFFE